MAVDGGGEAADADGGPLTTSHVEECGGLVVEGGVVVVVVWRLRLEMWM